MSPPVFLVRSGSLDGRPSEVVLDGDEGRHAAVVRRISTGEEVRLADGQGRVARCVVREASRTGLVCRVVDVDLVPAPRPRVVVIQALPKGDRGVAAVDALTEVGVDEIVPWAAERSITRWSGDRGERALARWRATAREAAKQARRAWVPEIADQASTDAVTSRLAVSGLPLVLHEGAGDSLGAVRPVPDDEVVLVVGPEGGISPSELSAFEAAGARTVHLGPAVLRTSTAGVVAAGVLLSRTSRWSHPPRGAVTSGPVAEPGLSG